MESENNPTPAPKSAAKPPVSNLSEYYSWWTLPRWNRCLLISLGTLAVIYALLHGPIAATHFGFGGEYVKLTKDQLAHISAIYTEDAMDTPGGKCCIAIARAEQVRQFLDNDFNQAIDPLVLNGTADYLKHCTGAQATSFLSNKLLKVKSYFWLSGSELYWEVLFWSLAGVFASLIFMLSSRHRNSVQYSDTDGPNEPYCPEEVPYQIGKLFYAPLCTMVLIFGYNYAQGDNRPDIYSGKGMLALAFLCGFFSGRVMTFINRIKEAIIPANSASAANGNDDGDNGKKKNDDAGQPAGAVTGAVEITLIPDPGLDPVLLQAIIDKGFRQGGTVILQHEDGAAPITADPAGDDPVSKFTAGTVPAGKYVVNATWTGDVPTGGDEHEGPHTVTLTATADLETNGTDTAAAELTLMLV